MVSSISVALPQQIHPGELRPTPRRSLAAASLPVPKLPSPRQTVASLTPPAGGDERITHPAYHVRAEQRGVDGPDEQHLMIYTVAVQTGSVSSSAAGGLVHWIVWNLQSRGSKDARSLSHARCSLLLPRELMQTLVLVTSPQPLHLDRQSRTSSSQPQQRRLSR